MTLAISLLAGLVKNLGYLTCSYCAAALTDCETQVLVQSHRSDEHNIDLHVVARHYHLYACREGDLSGDVKSTDEELGTVVVVERSVTATLFLLQDVDLSEEVLVRSDGAGLCDNLAAPYFLLVDTAEEETYVVSGLTLVKKLAEHLDAGDYGLLGLVAESYDLCRVVDMDGTGLDTSGNYGSTSGD